MATVKIIHPELGEAAIAEVDADALPHYYRSGWRRLTEAEEQTAAAPPPEPKPMTRAQARAAKAATAEGKE